MCCSPLIRWQNEGHTCPAALESVGPQNTGVGSRGGPRSSSGSGGAPPRRQRGGGGGGKEPPAGIRGSHFAFGGFKDSAAANYAGEGLGWLQPQEEEEAQRLQAEQQFTMRRLQVPGIT